MLAIHAELLWGTYRADPDGSGVTGNQTRAEWPPAPTRLLAALVAADGTGGRCRVTDGSELGAIESAPPPVIIASPEREVAHTPLLSRFVVRADSGFATSSGRLSTHQEYLGRTGTEVRPGASAAPRSPHVVFLWDIDVDDSTFEAIRRRCARVGYLGCADSPVRLWASRPRSEPDGPRWEPDPNGTAAIRVPRPGVLAAMDAHFETWLEHGPSASRLQSVLQDQRVWYRSPDDPDPESEAGRPKVLWFRFDRPVPGRRVVRVTDTLRRAVLARYQQILGVEPPDVLLGHNYEGRGFEHARWLALADVGSRHSRGRIHGAALWLPPDTPSEVVAACRQATRGVWRLYDGSSFEVEIAPHDGSPRPLAARPMRWVRPSVRWATAFPAMSETWARRVDRAVVERWCQNAGISTPVVDVRVATVPLLPGVVSLAKVETIRPGRDDSSWRPYFHVEITFAEPVSGPVVIGRGRHFGLGLCAPRGEASDG